VFIGCLLGNNRQGFWWYYESGTFLIYIYVISARAVCCELASGCLIVYPCNTSLIIEHQFTIYLALFSVCERERERECVCARLALNPCFHNGPRESKWNMMQDVDNTEAGSNLRIKNQRTENEDTTGNQAPRARRIYCPCESVPPPLPTQQADWQPEKENKTGGFPVRNGCGALSH
jgi:hypothetical protein